MLVPKLHAVRSRNVSCKLQVRPYTLRRGDTLSSIAEKRGVGDFCLDGAHSTPAERYSFGQAENLHSVQKHVIAVCPTCTARIQSGCIYNFHLSRMRHHRHICANLARLCVVCGPMTVSTWLSPGADMQLKRLIKLNHEIDPNNVGEGQTIVVPVGKLSDRDRLILDGMGQGRYRTYPIRKGEKLEEVLSKRGISMEEFEKLNPGVNPKKVPGMLSPLYVDT